MARKLLKCSKANPGGMAFCMFSRLDIETRAGSPRPIIPDNNCKICLGDTYNLWPASSLGKDGDKEWHQFESLDMSEKAGTRMYQFEALTPHNTTGDEYSIESDLSADQAQKYARIGATSRSREFAEIHPCYHLVEFNVPLNRYGKLDDSEPVTVSGRGTFIVSQRWVEDRFGEPMKAIGKAKVEDCLGIYGAYDIRKNMVIHRAMRDYSNDIPGWINYTTIRGKIKPKAFNIHVSNMSDIASFISETVNNSIITARIIEAYQIIKDAEAPSIRSGSTHIDMWRLMLNNGLSRETVKTINQNVSTKNPRTPFQSSTGNRTNLEKLRNLYIALRPKRKYIVQKETGYSEVLAVSPFEARIYMANIVNCVLNDPVLAKIDPRKEAIRTVSPYSNRRVHSSKKYWFAMEIINLAMCDGILTNGHLPQWVRNLYSRHMKTKEGFEHVHGNFYYTDKCDKNPGVYSDFLDALSMGLMEPYQLYPPMKSMKDLLEPKIPIELRGLHIFSDMCRAISTVTPSELKLAWEYFIDAYKNDSPAKWWDFIDKVLHGNIFDQCLSLRTTEDPNNFAKDLWDAGISMDSWDINIDERDCLAWNIPITNSSIMVDGDDDAGWLESAIEDATDEADPEIGCEESMGMSNICDYGADIDYNFIYLPSIDKIQHDIDIDTVNKMGK